MKTKNYDGENDEKNIDEKRRKNDDEERRRRNQQKNDVECDENDVNLMTKNYPVLTKLDYYLAYDTSEHRQLSPNLSLTIRHCD